LYIGDPFRSDPRHPNVYEDKWILFALQEIETFGDKKDKKYGDSGEKLQKVNLATLVSVPLDTSQEQRHTIPIFLKQHSRNTELTQLVVRAKVLDTTANAVGVLSSGKSPNVDLEGAASDDGSVLSDDDITKEVRYSPLVPGSTSNRALRNPRSLL
jgi:hypothetical protein